MLPGAFLERMEQMLGEEYGAFLESCGKESAQALKLNPGKIGSDGRSAARRFGSGTACPDGADRKGRDAAGQRGTDAEGRDDAERAGGFAVGFAYLWPVPWAEDGYYYLPSDQPGKHPFHEAGLYYIQEPSAMAPAELLDVQPGERILDLCAAPGGKSVQLAAGLSGSGILVCNEIHPARAKILSENIERMGIGNACVLNETPQRLAEAFPGYFDRVLVDAPCSGEGMFRKNEAACEEWSPENVRLCAERQDGILDCAAKMLRSGGRLVYSTCTFAPEEDEGSVGRFLGRHEGYRILPIEKEKLGLAGCDGMPEIVENPVPGLEDTLRLWPQRVRGEGHFAAVLEKDGNVPDGHRNYALKDTVKETMKEASGIMPEEFRHFCAESLKLGEAGWRLGEAEWKTGAADWRHGEPDRKIGEPARKTAIPEAEKSRGYGRSGGQTGRKAGGSPGTEELLSGLGEAVGLKGALKLMKLGDNLYLAPADMPSLKGLKALRQGLHLGEVKKKRFEPSHALALALRPACAARVWNLDSGNQAVSAYLSGQTFPAEGEKGWYLICVDGFGIGWGKLAAGSMKNHYPRGLRK